MSPWYYTSEQDFKVKLQRICCNCGHAWEINYSDTVASSDSTQEEVYRNLKFNIEEKIIKYDNDKEILCPKCSHFSKNAMEEHFPQGIKQGILKKYKKTIWTIPGGVLGIAWIPGLIILLLMKIEDMSLLWLILAVPLALYAIYYLIFFFTTLIMYNSIKKAIINSCEEDILQLLLEYYKKNKYSLADYNTLEHAGISPLVKLLFKFTRSG